VVHIVALIARASAGGKPKRIVRVGHCLWNGQGPDRSRVRWRQTETYRSGRPLPLERPSSIGQLPSCHRSLAPRTTAVRCVAAGDDMIGPGLWQAARGIEV